jgi:electron transfer flavoprotein alpha subunit
MPACIIIPAGAFGDEMAVALAERIDAHLLGHVSEIALQDSGLEVTRPAFGGRVALTLHFPVGMCVATMRSAQKMAGDRNIDPELITVAPALPSELAWEMVALTDRKASLEGARLVVCGGRGLDAASFEKLDNIADALGGVVGGSLPAVDAGLAPVSHQVGQSGKFVTPKLYLGIGVSGTLQHLAGIGAATPIVAINTDSEAAIFRYAELGVVADAREFLPMLINELNA